MLLKTDFENDPTKAGWIYDKENPSATRVSPGHQSLHCLSFTEGTWESPLIPVKPFEYTKITFYSKAEGRQYWSAQYYDSKGQPIVADHYWSIDQSDDWIKTVFCSRARINAATVRIRFSPLEGKRLWVDDVSVEPINHANVLKWAAGIYSGIPPVKYEAHKDRWKLIGRTMEKLQKGEKVRILGLGDSIINDTLNGPWDLFLERMYPGAEVELITSVRGGTGTQYYQNDNRVQEYVLQYNPDLLIIGGISNADAEATRSVIRQVRAKIDPDIIVSSGAVCEGMDPTTNKDWTYDPDPKGEGYRNKLVNVAKEEKVEFLDFTGPWGRYIADSGKPLAWFQRDVTHANVRGAMVLSKILEAYFAPKDRSVQISADDPVVKISSWRGELE